jgi:galactofuranose transport system permease protein
MSPVGHVVAAREEVALIERDTRGERIAQLVQGNAALIVLIIACTLLAPTLNHFWSSGNLANVAGGASYNITIGVGMTFVIISGGIDLSVGSMFALGEVLAVRGSSMGPAGALLLPALVCASLGLVQGMLIARARIPAFIITLAGLLGIRGLAYFLTNNASDAPSVPAGHAATIMRDFGGKVFDIEKPFYLALAAVAVGYVLLTRTRFGQNVYAIGGSESAATLMGIPVRRTKATLYTMSGLLAGLAGASLALKNGNALATVGVGQELQVIAAVVIGGTLLTGGAGSVIGSLWGVLLFAVVQNGINLYGGLGQYAQQLVSATFLGIVVVVQSVLSRRGGGT